MSLIRRRAALEWVVLCALSVALAGLLSFTNIAVRADNLAYDAISRSQRAAADDEIVIVAIDNRSLAAIGRWPWPRSVHARALDIMAAAKPKAVVYDVLFVEPATPAADDEALGAAMDHGVPVFLPMVLEVPGPDGQPYAALPPIPPLARTMAGSGHVMARPDDDGVMRHISPGEIHGGRCWLHLTQVVHDAITGQRAGCADDNPRLLIPYRGPAGHHRTISFASLAQGEVPPAFLKDKIVLVGAVAAGLGDQYATPMQSREDLMSGVEINANILAGIMRGDMRREAGAGWTMAFACVPLTLLWLGFLLLRPRGNLLLSAALIILIFATSALLLQQADLWLPPAAAAVPILILLPIWGWRRLAAASRYLIEELGRLNEEPGGLGNEAAPVSSGDRIELQMNLLGNAVSRMRALKHFIEESHASLPDATVVTNPDGQIALANDRAHDLFEGCTLRRAEGDALILFDALSKCIAEGGDAIAAIVRRAAEGSTQEQECEIVLDDGRAMLFRLKPGFDPDGRVAFFISRFTDITELRTASRQRDQMLQFLTHDMRAPQASILALLKKPLDAATGKRIEGHARQTLELADNFVQLARAETRQYDVAILDLRDIATEAADQLWDQAEARGIRIALETGDDEILVRGNAPLLMRAAANLIGNAIKYNAQATEVHVSVDALEGQARLSVQDHGRGMSDEELSRLYTRFTRFGETGTDGVGLGLVFVRTVAENHGGAIHCTSTPGEGSCFTLTLPQIME
ncbi:CHASE2 domain-containing protein [Sphingobium boeckii]|uniref:histidine kinase n=1 Tax=Sphingobium boeckii TaxID=1082345 RepID=A0A7W9EDS5_9SPHN|nr:CHASE2 domain-containing protein [Sphingobium boeckii]MBB5684275.1 CHASE2 domain-containing sensor protein/signal transduction histidine kinase [Sphingobium boeckii]